MRRVMFIERDAILFPEIHYIIILDENSSTRNEENS